MTLVSIEIKLDSTWEALCFFIVNFYVCVEISKLFLFTINYKIIFANTGKTIEIVESFKIWNLKNCP